MKLGLLTDLLPHGLGDFWITLYNMAPLILHSRAMARKITGLEPAGSLYGAIFK